MSVEQSGGDIRNPWLSEEAEILLDHNERNRGGSPQLRLCHPERLAYLADASDLPVGIAIIAKMGTFGKRFVSGVRENIQLVRSLIHQSDHLAPKQ